jgi:hypothetical protein
MVDNAPVYYIATTYTYKVLVLYFYMEEKKEIHIVPPGRMQIAAIAALAALALWGAAEAISSLKGLRYVGAGVPSTNTITVSGEGEVFAVPDIASFSVSVREEASDVETAQAAAAEKMNAIISYLKDSGVEDRDIKTINYNVYPRYEYRESICREGYCPPSGDRELVGFEVSQTLSVKVRDTERAGDILSGVGSRGASDVSGLSFTIDEEDALLAEARAQAIEDARGKAKELADDLNVRLVRVVGFSEYGGDPYYKATFDMALGAAESSVRAAPAPSLPTGENKIISNVSVTYEIR